MKQTPKQTLVEMFRETLRRLDVGERMNARIHCERGILTIGEDLYDLASYEKLQVVAIGKAASTMAAAFDTLVGQGRATGIIVPPHMPADPLPNFRYIPGEHPYPNDGSFEAARAVLSMLEAAGEESLIVYLISGGGSALFESPLHDASFYETLVTCGANIYEMNVMRKHVSEVKGGRLAVAAWPARQVTVYVSDVPNGKDSTIASGPTMPDESTITDCREIAARYGIALPEPLTETPKPGDPYFERSRYLALMSNQDAIDTLMELARAQGWHAESDVTCDDWPMERAASYLLDRLRALPHTPSCIVSGGELSCPVSGQGIGGRNQAFVLQCATQIAGERIAVLSGGTDGADGNSPAAGAVADGATLSRSQLNAHASLQNSDSHTYFAALDDAIMTGPTGNNVRDLRILVKY